MGGGPSYDGGRIDAVPQAAVLLPKHVTAMSGYEYPKILHARSITPPSSSFHLPLTFTPHHTTSARWPSRKSQVKRASTGPISPSVGYSSVKQTRRLYSRVLHVCRRHHEHGIVAHILIPCDEAEHEPLFSRHVQFVSTRCFTIVSRSS